MPVRIDDREERRQREDTGTSTAVPATFGMALIPSGPPVSGCA